MIFQYASDILSGSVTVLLALWLPRLKLMACFSPRIGVQDFLLLLKDRSAWRWQDSAPGGAGNHEAAIQDLCLGGWDSPTLPGGHMGARSKLSPLQK